MKKVSFNDIMTGSPKRLMKTYGLTTRQLEVQVRDHLYGANRSELNKEYGKIYSPDKNKDA